MIGLGLAGLAAGGYALRKLHHTRTGTDTPLRAPSIVRRLHDAYYRDSANPNQANANAPDETTTPPLDTPTGAAPHNRTTGMPAESHALPIGERDGHPVSVNLAAAPTGIAVLGPGADRIVLALLVTVLSRHGQVVITTDHSDALFGATQPNPTPAGLHVVADLDEALAVLAEEAQLRATDPDTTHPSAPMVLILADPPTDPVTRDDLTALLQDGHPHGINVISYGHPGWEGSHTLSTDGQTVTDTSGAATNHLHGARIYHLHPYMAAQLCEQLNPEQLNADQTHNQEERDSAATPATPKAARKSARQAPASAESLTVQHATDSPEPIGEHYEAHAVELAQAHPESTSGLSESAPRPTKFAPALGMITGALTATAPPAPAPAGHAGATSSDPASQAESAEAASAVASGIPAGAKYEVDRTASEDHSTTSATQTVPTTELTSDVEPTRLNQCPLRLEILDNVRLLWTPPPSDDGMKATPRDITPPGDVPAQLLTYLALNPGWQPRRAIAGTIWPEPANPERPTAALNTTISRLQRTITAATNGTITDLITSKDTRCQLNTTLLDVDYWELLALLTTYPPTNHTVELAQAYRAILTNYRGELAANLTTPEWIEPYRQNTLQRTLKLVIRLADHLTEQNNTTVAIDLLEHAKNLDTRNEPLYQTLIRTQSKAGLHQQAHQTYRELADQLAKIDAEPSDQTADLLLRLGIAGSRTAANR